MDRERPLRVLPAGLRRLSGSPFSDLSAENMKILATVVVANLVTKAKNYFLVAVGVISSVGPIKVALVAMVVGFSVNYWVYRPALRCGWYVWRTVLLLGVNLGVNNVAVLYTFYWIRPQTVAPLGFLCTVVFVIGADIVRDARKRNFSTAIWPILALPGIWALMSDSADGGDGANFSPGPGIPILGHEIPGWILGVGTVIITAATYAFSQKRLEALDRDLKGKISTLSAIPALAILAVGASFMDGGWKVMTSEDWSGLLICAGAGLVAGLSNVLVIKAYERGLRAGAVAMLSPLMTLAGILMGSLVEMTAPGPLGWLGIVLIFVASYGATKYQGRSKTSGSD
ncbi:hypothetical protein GCM10010191_52160 [Actinomadura vinacea]|uniref:DMT family transporter n=1 Tax=Actinomadura vinacea TaxID=115336 RepID=A0ABN3JJA6_9ACTN